MGKNIHTVPHGNVWAVKQEGINSPLSIYQKKSDAQEKGASIARILRVEHVIHGRDGKIQDKDSYGNDPNWIKDYKY